ncbi:hypothetical protein H8E88_22890 [candidate division KSB1 bacterium]|nr:hypothetical protein [candidate division KSB1 bacterium]MBL7092607.1 hypothetical protein [candidate division KSB1 bacterium]
MKKLTFSLTTILLIALISCAARTRIFDIKQTPRRFHDKTVTVAGTVTNTISLPVLKVGVFQIDDGSGKIWVKPKHNTPFKGDRVAVTGTIKVGITISGRSFGVILFESDTDEPL